MNFTWLLMSKAYKDLIYQSSNLYRVLNSLTINRVRNVFHHHICVSLLMVNLFIVVLVSATICFWFSTSFVYRIVIVYTECFHFFKGLEIFSNNERIYLIKYVLILSKSNAKIHLYINMQFSKKNTIFISRRRH